MEVKQRGYNAERYYWFMSRSESFIQSAHTSSAPSRRTFAHTHTDTHTSATKPNLFNCLYHTNDPAKVQSYHILYSFTFFLSVYTFVWVSFGVISVFPSKMEEKREIVYICMAFFAEEFSLVYRIFVRLARAHLCITAESFSSSSSSFFWLFFLFEKSNVNFFPRAFRLEFLLTFFFLYSRLEDWFICVKKVFRVFIYPCFFSHFIEI